MMFIPIKSRFGLLVAAVGGAALIAGGFFLLAGA